MTTSVDDVTEAMKDVVDPELGINVVDLGLIYDVMVDESNIAVPNMFSSIWIVGKIINSAANARQSKNPLDSLIKSGVWKNKTSEYMHFIKNHKLQNLIQLQRNVFELDLANKGLIDKDFWYELDNIVIKLTSN